MTEIEKMFLLKALPPFDRLRDPDLVLIAQVIETQRYGPGEVVHPDAEPFRRLYILVEGGWQGPASPAPRVLGVGSLLYGAAAPGAIVAGEAGAVAITIRKTHFHTIANETPELLLGFIAQPATAEGLAFL